MNAKTFTALFLAALLIGISLRRGPAPAEPRRAAKKPNRAALPLSRPLGMPALDTLSPRCRAFHGMLLSLDLSKSADAEAAIDFELPLVRPDVFREQVSPLLTDSDPCAAMPKSHALGPVHAELLAQCRTERSAICFHLVQRYRALLIDEKTKGIPLETLRDESVLTARLAATFAGHPERRDHDAVIRIAERLDDVSPGKGFDRFALRMRYEKVLGTSDPAERARLREELSRSPSLELRVLLARDAGDADAMRETASEMREEAPEKSEYYHGGKAAFNDAGLGW